MEPDIRPPDTSTRLRLVDLRVNAERGNVHLGGRLAGVMTGPHNRSAAARRIAATIAGPRPSDADGSVDLAGDVVSVRSLPDPLLPRGAPIVITRELVRECWQGTCTRLRDELAATHATCRLEGYRIDAALERARRAHGYGAVGRRAALGVDQRTRPSRHRLRHRSWSPSPNSSPSPSPS